jgi:hypothetical protein
MGLGAGRQASACSGTPPPSRPKNAFVIPGGARRAIRLVSLSGLTRLPQAYGEGGCKTCGGAHGAERLV